MSDENVVGVVTSRIDELPANTMSTINVSSDHNSSICSSTLVPKISSAELEVNDIVVVSCFNGSYRLARVSQLESDGITVIYFLGPKYNIDMKRVEERITCEEIILVLDKMSLTKAKWYSISDIDLNLILDCISKRRLLNEKLENHDPIAEELLVVKNELLVLGKTRKERNKFVQAMEKLLLAGNNIKTKDGFEMVLACAKNKTLNITFDMIITSIINQAKAAFDLDPCATFPDLAILVAQTCFYGETVTVLDKTIMNNQNQNMKIFLRQCVAEIDTFSF